MSFTSREALIGVDLGGTKVATGRINEAGLGNIVYKLIPAKSKNSNEIIEVVLQAIGELMDDSIAGIGIGIPGLVDRENGVIYDIQNIPVWKEVHLKKIIETHFQVPVYLDNDANCFALGEAKFGSGKGEDDFTGLTLGTGMGSGIIKNGTLMPDAHCGSGEFGSIPYLDSIYEDYCSGKFFIKKFGLKGEELADAAAAGDKVALKAFDEFGMHIANAIKTIKLAVDPNKVIIGGSVAQSAQYFETSMWKSLLDFPFQRAMKDFDVIFSNVKNIAILGAASLCIDRVKSNKVETLYN